MANARGRTLGLVGESESGSERYPAPLHPSSGRIVFGRQASPFESNRLCRGRPRMQMIVQGPRRGLSSAGTIFGTSRMRPASIETPL